MTVDTPNMMSPVGEYDHRIIMDSSNEKVSVFVFHACSPSRRFASTSDQSLIEAFVPRDGLSSIGLKCGRISGLRLQEQNPVVLTANTTAHLSQGLSLSLWFRPGNTVPLQLQTMLTIRSFENNDEYGMDGCRGNVLQIGQYGAHTLLRYRDSTSSCRVLLLRSVELDQSSVSLFTMTTNTTDTIAYLNETMLVQSYGLDLSAFENLHQNLNNPEILLLGSQEDIDYFQGSIYQLSFTNSSLPDVPSGLQSLWTSNQTTFNSWWEKDAVFPIFDVSDQVMDPPPLLIPQGSNESHNLFFPVANPIRTSGKLRILSLPKQGFLHSDGYNVSVESNIELAKTLQYTLLNQTFFNNPQINVHGVALNVTDEFFSYQVRAFDDDGFLVGESKVFRQPVVVQLANHRPQIEAPDKVNVEASTSPSSPVSGLTVPTIVVRDEADYDINLVRVDLSSLRGSLTVATPEARQLLARYYPDCSGRSASPWQCTGDGWKDRRLVFLAAPSDIAFILKDLQYTGLTTGRRAADNITVVVYDGQDGECLTAQEHWEYQKTLGNRYPSLHTHGCTEVQATIAVPGVSVGSTGGGHYYGSQGSAESILPDMLFWSLCIVTFCCFSFSRLRQCAIRGTAIEADGDDDDGDDDDDNDANVNRNSQTYLAPQPRPLPENLSLPRRGVDDDVPTDDSIISSLYWEEFSIA